jgi:hypothetical protein
MVACSHHLLYDVLILDHPSVSNFNQLRERLRGFRVAVLPVVQALSDADAAVLAAWVRAGGELVAVDWQQTAMYDEDFVPRPTAGVPGSCRCAALQALRNALVLLALGFGALLKAPRCRARAMRWLCLWCPKPKPGAPPLAICF